MDEDVKRCGLLINGSIDLNQVLTVSCNEKKKVARKRWAILAKALKSPSGSEPSSPTDECSVRRISSFMLLTTSRENSVLQLHQDKSYYDLIKKRTWYKYSMCAGNEKNVNDDLHVVIGYRKRTFSAEDLMGFNNTGNICIWPSEETLCFYVGTNLEIFRGKSVLELGGGMSCLAGLFCGKYSDAKSVILTDGNKISIENVEASMFCNDFKCPVEATVLKWGTKFLPTLNSLNKQKFDMILCADCLFFDEARSDLIETFCDLLDDNGMGLIMAPRRGNTLAKFVEQSEAKGFRCNEVLKYSDIVWEKHLGLLENNEYDENIHYPLLIELTKTNKL
ncbi:calmodulin-lysine N-methyltransferase [Onthophagus taurus]|uniref:calmodulin-lysine N-methyltransferase n=1 Tax=Onthophagus taurus TaxID=166361 RepID=UPI000C20DFDE|nr:calmodulin-lysine N-methyltransferase-like isoform X1 [Onthophagus taurus]